MGLLLILYCIFAISVLIWCTLLEPEPVRPNQAVHYVVISPALLNDWRRTRSDVVAIDLSNQARNIIAEALKIRPNQLSGLLRWIPPKTTLVFCGMREGELCCDQIEPTLVRAGINVVYVVNGSAGSSTVSASLQRARA